MQPSPESSKRLRKIRKRIAKSLKSYANPPDPTKALPKDAYFSAEDLGDLVTEKKHATSWADFQHWISGLGSRWSFRGHREEYWRLIPSLERATTLTREATDGRRGVSEVGMFPGAHERHLLHEFQRGAHQHIGFVPEDHETLDWLALMQHHGAPTRLLDWTRSPYVALYLAIEAAQKESAVWAIDLEWLDTTSTEILRRHDPHCPDQLDFKARCEYFSGLVFKEHTPWNDDAVVVSTHPMRKNERMTAQQGHFLRGLSYSTPFDLSLFWMVRGKGDPTAADRPLRKLVVSPCERIAILKELRRMNIHCASLFPGLDGFARSLQTELEIGVEDDNDRWRAEVAGGFGTR